jgi:hypothetical protein
MRLLGWAADADAWVSFGHDPEIAFAKIEQKEEKWVVRQSQS